MRNLIILSILVVLSSAVLGFPRSSMELYGPVHIDGVPAENGTRIEVIDASGTVCGSFVVKQKGIYGLLSCNGDDPATQRDEGAGAGEIIAFFINKELANAPETVWKEGATAEVAIFTGAAPPELEEPKAIINASIQVPGFYALLVVFALALIIILLIGLRRWRT